MTDLNISQRKTTIIQEDNQGANTKAKILLDIREVSTFTLNSRSRNYCTGIISDKSDGSNCKIF